jgi:PPOX class probable F420-dependent enzyme
MTIDTEQAEFLDSQRVGHLATCNREQRPHCVPVCFAHLGAEIWIALDQKPKSGRTLRRVRNIEENPRVNLVFDHYEENWSRLRFLMVEGVAQICPLSPAAREKLRTRYVQYREMELRQGIRVEVERVVEWRADSER